MRIAGKGALVVGGASGLGEATARRLHAAGAHVTVADVSAERGEALARELGERARYARTDVTRPEQVEAAVARAAEAPDRLRIAVNCAGVGWAERTVGREGQPHQAQPFETVIAVNLLGSFHVLRFAAAAMAGAEPDGGGERGVCVLTASVAAFEGQVGQLAYAASKGGVVSMTLPAARDLSRTGVRVVTIAPGLFDTPLLARLPEEARTALAASIPFPRRLGHPQEYAALACHIVENPMLNGEVVRLDGALRMAPR